MIIRLCDKARLVPGGSGNWVIERWREVAGRMEWSDSPRLYAQALGTGVWIVRHDLGIDVPHADEIMSRYDSLRDSCKLYRAKATDVDVDLIDFGFGYGVSLATSRRGDGWVYVHDEGDGFSSMLRYSENISYPLAYELDDMLRTADDGEVSLDDAVTRMEDAFHVAEDRLQNVYGISRLSTPTRPVVEIDGPPVRRKAKQRNARRGVSSDEMER